MYEPTGIFVFLDKVENEAFVYDGPRESGHLLLYRTLVFFYVFCQAAWAVFRVPVLLETRLHLLPNQLDG